MTNQVNPAARTMWEMKDYSASVKIGLECVQVIEVKSFEQFAERFLNLSYALLSAGEANLFNEFKRIFPSYIAILMRDEDGKPPIGYHNNAILMQRNFTASLFQFYETNGQTNNVPEALELLSKWTGRVPDKSKFEATNSKLVSLVTSPTTGKSPYFIISFKLPFALPLPNGSYQVGGILDAKTITIESFSAVDVTSRIGDRHFSKIEIKIRGYTCTNNYWIGPDLEALSKESRNSKLALTITNQIILNAKLVDESLRLVLASQNDIGNITTTQYDSNDEQFHFSMALGFGGFALVDVLSRQELNEQQVRQLSKNLIDDLLLHEELYAQALIERSNMNLIGAFYLLNSSAEAMIDYFLTSLSTLKEKKEQFEMFIKGDSYCKKCDLFKAATTIIEPPRSALPPSPFHKLKFIQEIGFGSSSDVRRIQSMLSRIRNDKMRNDLSHGRNNNIYSGAVDDAIKGFQELRLFFTVLTTTS